MWKHNNDLYLLPFLDEIDALMKNHNDSGNETASAIVSALLNEMQGRRNQVYVLGNTNVPSGLGKTTWM